MEFDIKIPCDDGLWPTWLDSCISHGVVDLVIGVNNTCQAFWSIAELEPNLRHFSSSGAKSYEILMRTRSIGKAWKINPKWAVYSAWKVLGKLRTAITKKNTFSPITELQKTFVKIRFQLDLFSVMSCWNFGEKKVKKSWFCRSFSS